MRLRQIGYILSTLFLAACVTEGLSGLSPLKKTMDSNRKLSALEGQLVVSTSLNNSNIIDLTLKNMAKPSKISPKAKAYVVWEVLGGTNMKPQSIGVLNPDKFSNARLMTATPFRQFDLFVTAEASSNPGAPTGQKLLWTSVSR